MVVTTVAVSILKLGIIAGVLLMPETAVRIAFFVILMINAAVFVKVVLPGYQLMFADRE